MTIRRTAPLIVLALAALIGGTLATVKVATDSLLHQRATAKAERWAHYVAENVADLEQIAAGEQPSAASMAFFQWSMRVGSVVRYEIYNRQGYSQLVSDRQRTALVDVSEFKPDAAAVAKSREISAAVKEGGRDDLPAFFAEAYVPVVASDRTIAVVAAYVDETEERTQVVHTFLLVAGGLCALTSLAFVVPAGAWYRRTLEKERADAEIEFLARHDGMTRLANRPHLNERLTELLDRAVRTRREIALLHLDIDHFKNINDRFDHQIGDAVLQLVGDRIRESTGPEDLIARIAGDEFVIVQTDIPGDAEAEHLAQRLVEIMSHPFLVGGREIAASASVGVALAPRDGRDPERLMHGAELALDRCKAEGGNGRRFFTLDLDIELQQRLRLETAHPRSGGQRRVRPARPAAGRHRGRADHRVRGAAPPARRRRLGHPALDVHPDRRADRPDRPDRRLGHSPGLPHRRAVARPAHHRGQPVAGPVRRHGVRRGARRARGQRARSGPAAARDHRKPAARGHRVGDGAARATARRSASRSSWTTSAPAIRA